MHPPEARAGSGARSRGSPPALASRARRRGRQRDVGLLPQPAQGVAQGPVSGRANGGGFHLVADGLEGRRLGVALVDEQQQLPAEGRTQGRAHATALGGQQCVESAGSDVLAERLRREERVGDGLDRRVAETFDQRVEVDAFGQRAGGGAGPLLGVAAFTAVAQQQLTHAQGGRAREVAAFVGVEGPQVRLLRLTTGALGHDGCDHGTRDGAAHGGLRTHEADLEAALDQYVFDKYGARGAAMTAVVITYRTRLAVREMGKVLGLGTDAVDRLSKLLSSLEHRDDHEQVEDTLRQAGVDPTAPRITQLLSLVEQVRGLPRHLGQHTGGIVIAAGRLDEVVPIEPARMRDRRVVQWDKDDCADLGIIKIDLLGLGMLQAIEDSLEQIRVYEGRTIDLAHLPADDPATYAMIRQADTIGTFQIESRAQMATLPRMKPERFYDLVVEVAIIRPGPITGKMVHPYLNRRAGREPVRYPHPSLESILSRTLGVPIFQEQLLRVAMTAAGFTGGEAEELRRAMGFKRSVERMNQIEERLVRGMQERGFSREAQEEILRGITSFALYGFPESHAASFALIAYASAYLKRHHPAAFLAGLLNAQPMGFYSPATLVKDAQRHGVEVLPIDVAASDWDTRLDVRGGVRVRLGLRHVAGLRAESGARIERERPYTSTADLARRTGLRRDELDTLAELGALATIPPVSTSRRQALWQVAALERDANSLFAGVPPPDDAGVSPLPEMSALEETLSDYRRSGLTTGAHLMEHLRAELNQRGVLTARELRGLPNGRFVRTAGHAIVRQRPGTAKGFCFLTLEDETGTSNAVLTPHYFKRFRIPLHTAAIVEIAGPLQNVDDVIHVRVRDLRPLVAKGEFPGSHDYR